MASSTMHTFGVVFIIGLCSVLGAQDITSFSTTTVTSATTNNHKITRTGKSNITHSDTTQGRAPNHPHQNDHTTDGTSLKEELKTEDPESSGEGSIVLVDGRVPTVPGQLVKCRCGAKEVLTKNGCQRYAGDTYIFGEDDKYKLSKIPVSSLDVVVYEPECETQDGHREMSFEGSQFHLRRRGDILLMGDVGDLAGLRINNYCVSHYMDENGNVSWAMKKACIPPPSVPRCCPPGQAMNENGKCQPASSPSHLDPPVSADISVAAVPWPVMKNHINTITCTKDPIKTLPLSPQKSYLLNLPTGMVHVWDHREHYISDKYTFPNDFCVDAVETYWGKIEYSVKLCYSDPWQMHEQACDGNTCIRKCCKDGDVMDTSRFSCVPNPNTSITYDPPFSVNPKSSYNTVVGYPLCVPRMTVTDGSIDAYGQLHVGSAVFPPTRYCSDLFTDGKGNFEYSALACRDTPSTWDKVRGVLIPVSLCISLVFLALMVTCYCLVPTLLHRGGWCQLFHATSLMFAFVTNFLQLFGDTWDDATCVAVGLVMQFWYLCTFFWLTVLCFDAWRRIRCLSTKQPSPDTPLGRYMLFAYGGPLVISLVTTCMHFYAPDNVDGIIKPRLAVSKCWFPDTKELLAYFYGPSAVLFASNIILNILTYGHYLHLHRTSPGLKQLEGQHPESEVTQALSNDHAQHSRDAVADFKHQFCLLVLMSACWVFEILSWQIPPPELWALTDILVTLQGFFIFVFFMANDTKRMYLRRKFPMVFAITKKVASVLCSGHDKGGKKMSASSSVSSFSDFEGSSPPSDVKSSAC